MSSGGLHRVVDGAAAAGLVLFALGATTSIALSQTGVGIAAAALVARMTLARGRGWRGTPLDLPILLYLAAQVLAAAFSQHTGRSFRLLKDEWIVLFYFVFVQTLRDRREITRLIDLFMIAGSVTALYAVWQHAAGWDVLRDRPLEPVGFGFMATGWFGHHLTFGGAILMVAVIGLASAIAGTPGKRRFFYAAAGALAALATLWSYARTAWIGLLAGLLVALAFRRRRIFLAGVGAMTVLLALTLALEPSLAERASALVDSGSPASSARVNLWRTAARIWWDYPITGAGPGSFKTHFEKYKVPGRYFATGHPHNDILNIMVNSGIIGFAAFAAVIVFFLRAALRARSRSPGSMSSERALLAAGVAAVAAFLVAGAGQCYLSDEETGMIFWFVAAWTLVIARLAEERTRAEGIAGRPL
jgi:putative inorganic carbon (HCO3(-)) transporter